MSDNERISIREFARRMGCSEGLVRKAIREGRILRGVVREGKWPEIIPDVATAEWKQTYDPSRQQNEKLSSTLNDASGEIDTPKAGGNVQSLAEIKRLNAQVKLQLDAIELKRKKGELVEKRAVYGALFEVGQTLKNQVLSVADRVIDQVLAAPSRNDAHTILYKALVEALEAMADTEKIKLPE